MPITDIKKNAFEAVPCRLYIRTFLKPNPRDHLEVIIKSFFVVLGVTAAFQGSRLEP